MPSLSIAVPDLQGGGPLLEILITHSKPVLESMHASGQPLPQPRSCRALIDTGASSTVIKEGIAKELNLHPRGIVQIATPSCSSHQCNVYDVSVVFPMHRYIVELLNVIEAPLSGQNIDCLIGRDLLKLGIFIYEGYSNRFILSF